MKGGKEWKGRNGREGKRREEKGREGKGREGKRREEKGREGKEDVELKFHQND